MQPTDWIMAVAAVVTATASVIAAIAAVISAQRAGQARGAAVRAEDVVRSILARDATGAGGGSSTADPAGTKADSGAS